MFELIKLLVCAMPWWLKRRVLVRFWGYKIDASASIGFSYVFPKAMTLGPCARISHLNVVRNINVLSMGAHSIITRLNWIAGPVYKVGQPDDADARLRCALYLGDHSAITSRHLIDCSDTVSIGRFATLAGFRSQILTHSIDLAECRQRTKPVAIGEYCFVGTGCILLPGSALPARSVLAAGSTLTRAHEAPGMLYAGLPAVPKKNLAVDRGYFTRAVGFVN